MTAPDYTELCGQLEMLAIGSEQLMPHTHKVCTKASTAIAELQAQVEAMRATIRRTMTDPQRMIWRDDVEGICQSPAMCFEYGGHVRCGPCAIKQATGCGVETDHSVPNLPEVYRLRREIAALQPKDQSK